MPIMCTVQLPAGKAPEQIEATLKPDRKPAPLTGY